MSESSSKLLAALFAERRVLTVTEVTEQIKDALESEFFALHVQGEVSNYKRHQSGHWYFTLKDSHSQLRAVFYRQWNRLMRFEPENGLEVRLRGRLTVYQPRGEYQIVVEVMEPLGVGALQLAFEQQVRRLAAEGLFDEARKRKLPLLDVIITPVKVQGTGAAREIVDAIRLLNKHAKKPGNEIDVIIVGRGGGSIEDLWAFNEEPVARAIYESEIPVVSAVGHETDYTIADFVADYRAPTPSAAAEIVAAESGDLTARIEYLQNSLARAMTHSLLVRKSRLRDLIESRGFAEAAKTVLSLSAKCRELERRAAEALRARVRNSGSKLQDTRRRLEATDLRALIAVKSGRLDALDQRLSRAVQRRLEAKRHNMAVAASKLDMLSPLAVLGRGYALVKDEAGNLIPRAAMVKTGQKLALRFEDGEVSCRAD